MSIKKLLEKFPSIRSTQGVKDPATKSVLDSVKKIVETGMGLNGDDEAWTSKNSLKGPSGILADIVSNGGRIVPPISLDFTPPPRPAELSSVSTFSTIILSWKAPGYRNHSYTEIHRSTEDDLSRAVMIARMPGGSMYADAVDNNTQYYYWIRFVSTANVTGPFNADTGLAAQTETDPARVLESLTERIDESHLVEVLANGIDALRTEQVIKVDAHGRVAGIGVAVTEEGESGPAEGQVVIYADRFAVVRPDGEGGVVTPFVIGRVNGQNIVGINGRLVVDGSIHGRSIVAESIAADRLSVQELSAIAATMGTVTGGTFRTAEGEALRVEMTSEGAYLLWAGEGSKSAENAKFYIDEDGNAVFAGELRAANGTFTGTLEGVDGAFGGTIYARNLVGDVIDVLSVQRPVVGNTSIFPRPNNVVHDYTGIALTVSQIGRTFTYGSWHNVETFTVGAADFRRNAEFSGIAFLLDLFQRAEVRIRLNGTVLKTFLFGFHDGDMGGIVTTDGQVTTIPEPSNRYYLFNAIPDFYTIPLSSNTDFTIRIDVRARHGRLASFNYDGLVPMLFPDKTRKLSVSKASSEGVSYSS